MPWFLRMQLIIFPLILLAQIYISTGLYYSIKRLFPTRSKISKNILFPTLIFFNLFPLLIIFLKLINRIPELFILHNQLQVLDFILLFPYWWGLIAAVEILPYFVEADLLLLAVVLTRWKKKELLQKILAWAKILITVVLLVYTGIRIYYDTYHVRQTQHKVQIKNLPEALNGMKITLVGDIQVDRYTQSAKLEPLDRRLKQAGSDFLLFSGDLVTSGQYFIEQGAEFLCSQSAVGGQFACMGDHDYWANPANISSRLKNCGWNFLENDHQLVQHKGKQILFTGITHIYSQQISAQHLAAILEQAPEADLKVLLVHQPAPVIVEVAEKYGYQLVLGGHTHGGQIQFRPMGFTMTPSMFETPYYSGLYQVGNTTVVVTNGIGLTLAPVRYRAGAEINVIKIVSR
jgi:predicted MPP superfamily phosphohydrolase